MIEAVNELLQTFTEYVRSDDFLESDVLSLYLVVDPSLPENQSSTPAWQVFLRNSLTDIEAELDPQQTKQWKSVRLSDDSDETRWARTRLRLDNYLSDYRPAAQTLAIFVTDDGLLAYELPVRLENRAHYGIAQIKQFLWAVDEYQQLLVVLFGQDQVRSMDVFLGQAADEVEVHSDMSWQRKQRKAAHQANIAQRHDELDKRFIRYIADEIDSYFMQHDDVERIIFGGNARLAHAARTMLHPKVADQVIGILSIPLEASDSEIGEKTRELAESYERETDLAIVDDVINRAKAGGRGALGSDAVNQALDMQTVRMLVLPYPIAASVADELIAKAVKSSSSIEFVHGEAAEKLHKEGGIGALLYYTA